MTRKLTVRRVGPDSAEIVHAIVQEAFGDRPALNPPADALKETVDSIATRLALGGGLVAMLDGVPVGTLILESVGDIVYLRRFGVLKAARGTGIAAAMVQAASEAATSVPNPAGTAKTLSVIAREELPATVGFWKHRGFVQIDRRSPYVELSLALPEHFDVATPEDMRKLGERVAGHLRPGDLLLLTGDLGAGKTTFTQGLGAGLGVTEPITSPTFVIAREHAAAAGRPPLVHVDAYRLGSVEELDDLDLDAALDDSVTVVEWGEGKAEGLADSRLEIRISRADVAPTGDGGDDHDPRVVEIMRVGPRWSLR